MSGFEKTRDQVGATGERAGLRDSDGVGHAQRGGGDGLRSTASRISKRPIRAAGSVRSFISDSASGGCEKARPAWC